MEGSSPQMILLEESIKLSKFASLNVKTTLTAEGEGLSEWTSVENNIMKKSTAMGQHLLQNQHGQKSHLLKQTFSTSASILNKGVLIRLPSRRISPLQFGSKKRLEVKFEHFQSSSEFIEQYRNAKLVRLEENFSKMIEQRAKQSKASIDSCNSGIHNINIMNKSLKPDRSECHNISTSPTATNSSETGQCELRPRIQSGDLLKPSLPQTGYFTGKKWAYPKNLGLSYPHQPGGKRHTGPSFRVKKHEVQVFNTGNMCLKGIGKPLNTSMNKTWSVPLSGRTMCKSAPTNSHRSLKKVLSPRHKSHSGDCAPTEVLSKSQNFIDFSSFGKGSNSVSKVKKFVPKARTYHSFKPSRKSEGAFGQDVNDRQCLDYENMFKEVIDFYGHDKKDRSKVYVRIGT